MSTVGQRPMVPRHPGWDSGRCYERLGSARAARVQTVGAERSPSQDEVEIWLLMPRLVAISVCGWSNLSGVSPLPWWGERS